MFDTLPAAPDITTADLERWVDHFYHRIAFDMINDSEDLLEDWETTIKLHFRTFFWDKKEVKTMAWTHTGSDSFESDDCDPQRAQELYEQAEQMLYEKVRTHLVFMEKGIPRLLSILWAKFSAIIASFSFRGDDSTYADNDFALASTHNIPWSLPKDDKPRDYETWNYSLFW